MTNYQYIIGLGSNIGNRIKHLQGALFHLKKIGTVERVSPLYESSALLTATANPSWDKNYLNAAIIIKTTLLPEDLLLALKKIESRLGRDLEAPRWSPRVIDLDILCWKNQSFKKENLLIPHIELCKRPFALLPAAIIAPDWLHPFYETTLLTLAESFSKSELKQIKKLPQRLAPPYIMGIVNITPDSFSDGDSEQTIENIIHKIDCLIQDGANIIDLGAESTRPQAKLILQKTEWQRLAPILEIIHSRYDHHIILPQFSLDTRHAKTVKLALPYNIDYINDVSAFADNAMLSIVREAKKSIIFMHQLGLPAGNHYLNANINIISHILEFAKEKKRLALETGLSQDQLIFDPGIGFGKQPFQSLEIIKHLDSFDTLEVPICLGYSRKRFLNIFEELSPAYRDNLTHIITSQCMNKHAKNLNYLRVHDVKGTLVAINITEQLSI